MGLLRARALLNTFIATNSPGPSQEGALTLSASQVRIPAGNGQMPCSGPHGRSVAEQVSNAHHRLQSDARHHAVCCLLHRHALFLGTVFSFF